jgi:hypothetical protein
MLAIINIIALHSSHYVNWFIAVLCVLCIYCLYYVSIVGTLYYLSSLLDAGLLLTWMPDGRLDVCNRNVLQPAISTKAVSWFCWVLEHILRCLPFFLSQFPLQASHLALPTANAGMLPVFPFPIATTCFPCSPPYSKCWDGSRFSFPSCHYIRPM